MAQGTIQSYRVTHAVGGTTTLTIRVAVTGVDGRVSYVDTILTELAAMEAHHIVDLMRNEKPVTFDTVANTIATAASERAGEGEVA